MWDDNLIIYIGVGAAVLALLVMLRAMAQSAKRRREKDARHRAARKIHSDRR